MKCVYARTLYDGRKVMKDVYLSWDGTRVTGVSHARRGREAGRFDAVTPALVDPHSHIGIHRSGYPSSESEANEAMDSVLALVDVLDSIQMDDAAFEYAVELGVLYSCVMPGSGNLMGGMSAVIRHFGRTSNEALISRAGMKGAMGYNLMSWYEKKGQRGSTRMGSLAVLRRRLDEVRTKTGRWRAAKGRERRQITFSAEERILRDLLEKRLRWRVHAHKIDDISALLRLVDEFDLWVTVEHAMDVHQPEIFRELKKRNIPVIYGPVDTIASKVELAHKHWRNIRLLVDSGVTFGLMTDHPVVPAWNLLTQTRWFARAGLSKQDMIELVTRRNAQLIGLGDRAGTLEKKKWASFVCWNGDPMALTSRPVAVYGEGRRLYAESD